MEPMTETPPPGAPGAPEPEPGPTGTRTEEPPTGPRVGRADVRDLDRLRRSTVDRRIAGVAGGLGRHLDVDPTVLRVVLVVLCLFGGAGLVVYAAVWLFVPEDGASAATVPVSSGTRDALLIVAAVLAVLLLVGDSWAGLGFPWPLAILALVLGVVLINRDRPGTTPAQVAVPAWTPPDRSSRPAGAPTSPRGPALFWPTLALVALGLGVLGIVDAAGADVVATAYPALALASVGGMLVLGAFVGRPGGLVLLGAVAAAALAVGSLTAGYDVGRLERSPRSAAEVPDEYSLAFGTMSIDLSGVDEIEELDASTLHLQMRAGEATVVVPDGLDVDVSFMPRFGGQLVTTTDDGEQRESTGDTGGGTVLTERIDGGARVPAMRLVVTMLAGEVRVIQR